MLLVALHKKHTRHISTQPPHSSQIHTHGQMAYMDAGCIYIVWVFAFQYHPPFVNCTFKQHYQYNSLNLHTTLLHTHTPGMKSEERFLVGLLRAANTFASSAFVVTWSSI